MSDDLPPQDRFVRNTAIEVCENCGLPGHAHERELPEHDYELR